MISDFRYKVYEKCVVLGYYAARSSGNFLQTFRDNLSVPSSRAKSPNNYHYSLHNNTEESSSQ